jgi:hypothetical protein
MIKEIEIEDVGPYRLPNMWQNHRIMSMPRAKRFNASLAFGLGMTLQQFKALPADKQEEVSKAYWMLVSPSSSAPPAPARGPVLPRAYERLSEARMIELGRELLRIKAKLPHGEFGPWLTERSGVSPAAAQRYMRIAKASGFTVAESEFDPQASDRTGEHPHQGARPV